MKNTKNIMMVIIVAALMTVVMASCSKFGKEEKKADVKASQPAPESVVGEGLTEAEAKALLREEKVNAGTGIGREDVENELLRMEEEIDADIEGREPDFEKAGVKKELKPLVAKETFTPASASSDLDYERDMAVMKMIRAYVKQKKADDAKKDVSSPDTAPAKKE